MFKKHWLMAPLLSGFGLLLVFGCGQQPSGPPTDVQVLDQPSAQEVRLTEFDKQLADIDDPQSAKTALTTFVGYVAGSENSGGNQAAAVSAFSASWMDMVAQKEANARGAIKSGVAVMGAEEGISIDKITTALNAMKDPNGREISRDDVEFMQCGIRSEVPHIAVREPLENEAMQNMAADDESNGEEVLGRASEMITPMEALVIGYVAATGDEGTKPGAFKEQLPQDKVQAFLEKVTQ